MYPSVFDRSIGCRRIAVDRQSVVLRIAIVRRVIVGGDYVARFTSMLVSFLLFFFFLRYNRAMRTARFQGINTPVRMSAHVFSRWLRNSCASCCMSLSKVPKDNRQQCSVELAGSLLFSFRSLLMNFFGCRAPVRLLPDIIMWNRSARHVNKFSFLFFCVKR